MDSTQQFAQSIRQHILAMAFAAGGTHIAPSFSITDILAVLYNDILEISPKQPDDENRDRFVLSKGHASAAIFATLALKEFFKKEHLKTYCQNESILGGHPDVIKVPGIEASTGSLGHGFGIACGMAYAAKLKKQDYMTYSIVGDGEIQEGSIWETAMTASQLELDNFVGILDFNKLQGIDFVKNVTKIDTMVQRWESFGWNVHEVDGHDTKALKALLVKVKETKNGKPHFIFAHTIKGKGCSFMESQVIWHYRLPNEEELEIACKELNIDNLDEVLS